MESINYKYTRVKYFLRIPLLQMQRMQLWLIDSNHFLRSRHKSNCDFIWHSWQNCTSNYLMFAEVQLSFSHVHMNLWRWRFIPVLFFEWMTIPGLKGYDISKNCTNYSDWSTFIFIKKYSHNASSLQKWIGPDSKDHFMKFDKASVIWSIWRTGLIDVLLQHHDCSSILLLYYFLNIFQ